MARFSRFTPIVWAAAIVGATASSGRARQVELSDATVERAINQGVEYLDRHRKDDGTWSDLSYSQWPGSVTSLCVTALRAAGVPADDPRLKEPLKQLRTVEPKSVYQAALLTMALSACEPEKDLLLIRRNVEFLEDLQIREGPNKGCWTYINSRDASRLGATGDNSNTQWALAALAEAERVGAPTSAAVWKLAREYWINAQNPDGSWGYVNSDGQGTGSMTCAGITSLILAAERLDASDAKVDGEAIECCGERTNNEPVDRALQWLALNFSVSRNPGDFGHLLYYLVGLERVGRLTHRRLLGKHDWYREGAEHLLMSQAELTGYWKGHGTGESYEIVGTSMALMFLANGRRPVAAAKLAFGPENQSDRHRHDLANLVERCSVSWKTELTWQVISVCGATVDDYRAAPVLYLSASEKPNFSDVEVKALRQYVEGGGTILAENCCGGEFDGALSGLVERIFPERDAAGALQHRLIDLPPDHAVYKAGEVIDLKQLPFRVQGVQLGKRTAVIYYPGNLGCYWEIDRPRREKFSQVVEDKVRAHRTLGTNVMEYATGRKVKNKLQARE